MFTPDTEIYFLSVPQCDPTYSNLLSFSDQGAETSFYMGCAVKHFTGCRPTRDNGMDGTITVAGTPNDYLGCNMLMFKNSSLSNKWYYAFIGYPRIGSSGGTEVDWVLDVWRSYYWEWSLGETLVVREHVKSDKVGEWLYPENVETGEFVCDSSSLLLDEQDWTPFLVIGYSFSPQTGEEGQLDKNQALTIFQNVLDAVNPCYLIPGCNPTFAGGGRVHGIYQGTRFLALPMSGIDADIKTVNDRIQELIKDGQIDRVQVLVNVPYWLVQSYALKQFDAPTYPKNTDVKRVNGIEVSSPASFGGYVPHNKKLFTQQFNYLLMSNSVGSTEEYGYEYFKGNQATFDEIGQMSATPVIKLVPRNYKGVPYAYGYALDLTGFPNSSISYSSYANQQNLIGDTYYVQKLMSDSFSNVLNTVGDVANTVGGAAGAVNGLKVVNPLSLVEAGASIVSGAVTTVDNLNKRTSEYLQAIQQAQAHYREPQVTKGVATPGIMFAVNAMRFTVYKMQVQPQFAKLIDKFFDACGYAINQFKQPNLTGRRNWNYLKLAEPVVKGNLPVQAKSVLVSIFSSGVRIWHNPSTWLDYSQDNSIV